MKPLVLTGSGAPGQPDPDAERNPVWLRCDPCGHVWVGAWLPMLASKAIGVLRAAHCPNCGASCRSLRLARTADIPRGDRRPPREPPDRGPTRKPERRPGRQPEREPARRKGGPE